MQSVRPRLFRPRRTAWMLGAALLAAGPLVTPPALAQSQDDTRLRKLEQEVRALQRKVFPGSDGRYFEPEVTAPQRPTTTLNEASTGPVTDLLARMDAVESALSRLTAQTETNANALSLLNARVDALEASQRAAPPTGGSGGFAEELVETPAPRTDGRTTTTATSSNLQAMTTGAGDNASAGGVERPETGDAGDDAYVYGYRLWDAGRHADARSQLEAMLKKYPAHRRASWARNLIGRSYLDQGQPRPAAEWFLKNYLENRDGERAPDSLVYLASATLDLGNKAKACEALEEFRLVYPGEANGRLASLSSEVGRKAGCN